MIISQTIEERLIEQIRNEGNDIDTFDRIFYIKEGTTPTPAMRSLKMMGWKGQYEIR